MKFDRLIRPSTWLFVVTQTTVVLVSLKIGGWLDANYKLIPSAIVTFTEVAVSAGDWRVMLTFFGLSSLVVFMLSCLFFAGGVFDSARRAAIEIYALIAVFALAAVTLFFLTSINFSPEILVGASLTAFASFVATFVIARVWRASDKPLSALASLASAGFGFLVRPATLPGALSVLAFAATPVGLSLLYDNHRDFAESVTDFRMNFNKPDTNFAYVPVDAISGVTFRQPMLVRFSPADPMRAYVLERHGRIYRFDWRDPAGTKELVLDVEDRVNYVDIELGALGFDFHPNFDDTDQGGPDFIYLYHTDTQKDVSQQNRLSRFNLAAPDMQARRASEQVMIELDRRPNGFHNGGGISFGPDGFLYLGIGDATEDKQLQQIDRSLFGGVLRIDVDRRGGEISHPPARQPENGRTRGYFIPSDNPFVGVEGANEEYWALGLRNPFRMSFDPSGDKLWTGDVGTAEWEEVNLIEAGGNYQYPFIEGREETGYLRPKRLYGTERGPIYTYVHTAYERAVIGGMVYTGEDVPGLKGSYFFADNYSGHVYTIPASGDRAKNAEIIARVDQFAQRGITSFSNSPQGEMLLTTLGDIDRETGHILKLVAVGSDEARDASSLEGAPVSIADVNAAGLYESYCARCHAVNGSGQDTDMDEFEIAMPDFTSAQWQGARSNDAIRGAILNGGGEGTSLNMMMPPWEAILTREETEALVLHIRHFGETER